MSDSPSSNNFLSPSSIYFEKNKDLNNAYDTIIQYATRTDLIQHFYREMYILLGQKWSPTEDIIEPLYKTFNSYNNSLKDTTTILSAISLLYELKLSNYIGDFETIKNRIKDIMEFKVLSPLKFNENEFESITNEENMLRNIRLNGIYKKIHNNKLYDVNALVRNKIGQYDLTYKIYNKIENSMNYHVPICFWNEEEKKWIISDCLCYIKNTSAFIGKFQNTKIYFVEVLNIPHYQTAIYIALYSDIPRIFFSDYKLLEIHEFFEDDQIENQEKILSQQLNILNICNEFTDEFRNILKHMYD